MSPLMQHLKLFHLGTNNYAFQEGIATFQQSVIINVHNTGLSEVKISIYSVLD